MSGFFRAVATDYDFTLTGDGGGSALAKVAEARRGGLKVILVTGRILSELRAQLPDADARFDAIVAENGGVLAVGKSVRLLSRPMEVELSAALAARGIAVRCGQVLQATDAVHDLAVLQESRRLGLEVHLVRNRGALMILPPGVSKGAGVHHALGELGVSFHNTVAVGDAENDLSLLESCEVGVAVANAVDSLKHHADLVLTRPDGAGVVELFDRLMGGDLVLHPRRWQIELGNTDGGERVLLPASQVNLLVSGSSGSGKSFLAGLIAERLLSLQYSICVLDPEGDHVALGRFPGVVVIDGRERMPPVSELRTLIRHRFGSVVADLSLLGADDKRDWLRAALDELARLRAENGLPHWIILDEAHVPMMDEVSSRLAGEPPRGYCLVTYRPEELPRSFTEAIDFELRAGDAGCATLGGSGLATRRFAVDRRRTSHVRHWHKYVSAQLPPHQRFAFRAASAPTGHSAGNLDEFYRELERCSAEVVLHHALRGDFSRWTRTSLQDATLGNEFAAAEADAQAGAEVEEVRHRLLEAVAARYGATALSA